MVIIAKTAQIIVMSVMVMDSVFHVNKAIWKINFALINA
jgi:hypothetical protein